ncbi:ABC transporter substrate-binding protein [Castellaniella denitrificans]|uniref:ABC transporter substrate-binding protein n=1 Tax=Castellaniella denitrificans TaxID=56119 RepID=UPI001ACF3BAE|nr:ABC transporter substrate-binding protein [Burkholderiales bacterium]
MIPSKKLISASTGVLLGVSAMLAAQSASADDKVIPIGTVLAMTGSGAYYGKVMTQGEQLAIDEINNSKVLGDYTLALHTEDHKSGDSRAANSGARKLINVEKTNLILSSYGGITLAIQPLAAQQNVLLFNGGGTASTLVGKKNLYNTRMVASQLAPLAVKWAVENLKAKKIATIYYTDSSGTETNDAAKEACKQFQCEIIDEEPYKLGATDFSVPLARVKAANPDVIIVGSWGADVGHIVKQAKEHDIQAKIVGLELLSNELSIAGKNMDGYTAIFDSFDPAADNPATQAFVKSFKQAYGNVPGYYEANYYELVKYIIAPLIQKAIANGEDPTKSGVLNSQMEKLVAEKYQFDSVYGGTLQLHENGSITKPVGVYQVKDGQAVNIAHVENGKFVMTP